MVPQFAHTEIHDRHEFLRPVHTGAELQTGDVVTIEFLPKTPGGYEFACPMGVCPRELVVDQEV